jgi:hypothetical protein
MTVDRSVINGHVNAMPDEPTRAGLYFNEAIRAQQTIALHTVLQRPKPL